MIIIHAVNKVEFKNEIKTDSYGSKSLEKYGFIHCSEIETYPLVAPNFKDEMDEKLILVIDSDKLTSPLIWEESEGISFPHIYGPLNCDAIVEVLPHLWSEDRSWISNHELLKYKKRNK